LSPVLLEGSSSPRKEMFYYFGDEVFAVRQGAYKAHFKTKTEFVGQKDPVAHDPPLLYNLEHDPAEKYNIAAHHPRILAQLKQLKEDHEASVEPVQNQLILK
ncbi:MAG: arylsulfatase, partial [Planctomycetales bacterium]